MNSIDWKLMYSHPSKQISLCLDTTLCVYAVTGPSSHRGAIPVSIEVPWLAQNPFEKNTLINNFDSCAYVQLAAIWLAQSLVVHLQKKCPIAVMPSANRPEFYKTRCGERGERNVIFRKVPIQND